MGTRDVLVGVRTEENEDFVVRSGFGKRRQSRESCPHVGIKVLPQLNHHYHKWPSSSSSHYGLDGCSVSNSGLMFRSSSCQTLASRISNIYGLVGAKAVAFSADQLHQLEKHILRYKCMMAPARLAAELLMPITKHPSHSNPDAVRVGSSLNLGVSSSTNNSMDPEPWRCRRTDGKKWRCSRDLVPDHWYCERHSYKSVPIRESLWNHLSTSPASITTPPITTLLTHSHHTPSRFVIKTLTLSATGLQVIRERRGHSRFKNFRSRFTAHGSPQGQ